MSILMRQIHDMRAAVGISRGPFAALGLVGLSWGTFAAMVPALKAQMGAADDAFGTALIGGAIGGVIAMFFAPRVAERCGRWALPVLTLAVAGVLQLPGMVASVSWFFPMMIVFGVALAGLDVCANIRLSHLEEKHGQHLMNVNHAMFSFGFGLSAFVVAKLRQNGVDVGVVFLGLGVVMLALTALTLGPKWEPVSHQNNVENTAKNLPWPLILMSSAILFAGFIGENSTEAWAAIFIERELGGAEGTGSFGPAMLGAVMCVARLFGQSVIGRVGEERLLIGSGGVGAFGALVLASATTQTMALIGVSVVAVGVAGIAPTANALLGKSVRSDQRGLALSRAWMFGMAGYFIGPALMGFVSEHWGLRSAFVCIALIVILVVPVGKMIQVQSTKPSTLE